MCPDLPDPAEARIVRIHNTRTLGVIAVSENMLAEIADDHRMEIIGEPYELPFNKEDNLADLRRVEV